MSLYILPSIIAISLKLAILLAGKKTLKNVSVFFLVFVSSLCVVNLCELSLFGFVKMPEKGILFLHTYYVAALISCCSLLCLALDIRGKTDKPYIIPICIFYFVCTLIAIIPGLGLMGAESIGYSVTRIPGPYYPILQLGIVGGLLCSLALFSFSALVEKGTKKKKALALLISTTPLVLGVVTIVILMQLGVHVNATVVVSVCTTLMMGILIYTESKYGLFKFLAFIPNTEENQCISKLSELLTDPNITLKEAEYEFSSLMVKLAITRTHGDINKAADILGTSRTTILRRRTQK